MAVGILARGLRRGLPPIRCAFAHNPGGAVERHLAEHLTFFLHPFLLDTWVDRTYDLMFPGAQQPLVHAASHLDHMARLAILPTWLKRHAQLAALINFPLYFLFCMPGEFRDLSMLYITFLLIIAVNLQRWMQHAAPAQSARRFKNCNRVQNEKGGSHSESALSISIT